MPLAIQSNRFSELVKRYFSTKGTAAIESVLEDIFPVLNVDSPEAPELSFLRQELLYSSFLAPTAGAGVWPLCDIVNPAGSGVLAVVERVRVSAITTGYFEIGPVAPAGTQSTGQPRDGRIGLGQRSALQLVGGTVAAGDIAGERVQVLANTCFVYDSPLIVVPGSAFRVLWAAPSSAFVVAVAWHERLAEPSELR